MSAATEFERYTSQEAGHPNWVRAVVAALALFALSLVTHAHIAHAQLGVNLISDPSFEVPNGSLPDDWTVAVGDPARVDYSEDRPRTGVKLVKFDADANVPLYIEKSTLIPVEVGETYRLRMSYRMEEVTGEPTGRIYLRAVYHDAQQNPISWQVSNFGQIEDR